MKSSPADKVKINNIFLFLDLLSDFEVFVHFSLIQANHDEWVEHFVEDEVSQFSYSFPATSPPLWFKSFLAKPLLLSKSESLHTVYSFSILSSLLLFSPSGFSLLTLVRVKRQKTR